MAKTQKAAEQAANTETKADPAPATVAKESKSIVPAKYAGKYKGGGNDPLALFIKQECVGKDGFEFSAFFNLCRLNGIAADQVDKYEAAVASKAQGANGRARMTLRNMLGTIARKAGKLKKQDGTEQDVVVAKPAVSGAAAKAQETAGGTGATA